MINWLITMFTEWLMLIYYFHSFSNINMENPYNVFRLDILLLLSFNNQSWDMSNMQSPKIKRSGNGCNMLRLL